MPQGKSVKLRYATDPDYKRQRIQQSLSWKRNNTAKTRVNDLRSSLKHLYKITIKDFALLLEKQNGKCGICGSLPPSLSRLSVDHDHVTLKVRGLLCHRCNFMLGILDNFTWRKKAESYLQGGRSQ